MFGWSSWNSLANPFIWGESPTHEEKVTVTGLVGSFGTIGLIVSPDLAGASLFARSLAPSCPPPARMPRRTVEGQPGASARHHERANRFAAARASRPGTGDVKRGHPARARAPPRACGA